MTSAAATNVAAMAAAIHEATEGSYDLGMPSNRRSMTSSRGVGPKGTEFASVGAAPGVSGYPLSENATGQGRASHAAGSAKYAGRDGSAVADDLPPSSTLENDATNNKGRGRRASEGAHLIKGEGKRISGGELRCDQCGKGYKHSSCLTKHLSVPIVSHPPQTLPHEHAIPLRAKPQHAQWILVARSPHTLFAVCESDDIVGGSTPRSGPTPPSYSFPSTNRFNYLKLLLCLSP